MQHECNTPHQTVLIVQCPCTLVVKAIYKLFLFLNKLAFSRQNIFIRFLSNILTISALPLMSLVVSVLSDLPEVLACVQEGLQQRAPAVREIPG